jgi:hypothetical protein
MAIGNPVTLTSNVASKTISAIATASQTLFTVTGGYRLNYLSVFRNGTKLVEAIDFTARDGVSVTLQSPATVGDVLEFQIFDTFRVADAPNTNDNSVLFAGSVNIQGDLNVLGVTTIAGAATSVGFARTAYGLSGTPNITVGIISASSLSLTSGSIGFSTYVTLTSGTSWTVPSGVSLIKVYATGGGAGGVFNTGGIYARGGSGATSVRYYIVGSGTTASYAIGAGGAGTSSGGFGAVGGDTTFTYNTVTITGTGGIRANGFPQASQGSGGQINLYGGFASISSLQGYVSGDAPQATGYGLGGPPATDAGGNGQQGAIIIEY